MSNMSSHRHAWLFQDGWSNFECFTFLKIQQFLSPPCFNLRESGKCLKLQINSFLQAPTNPAICLQYFSVFTTLFSLHFINLYLLFIFNRSSEQKREQRTVITSERPTFLSSFTFKSPLSMFPSSVIFFFDHL